MKRTALKRGSGLQRKTPLRSASEPGRKPMQKACRKKKRAVQKDCRWRSEAYLKFVRSLPCSACGIHGCDAHHLIGLGWSLSGMGLTAPDSYALPLCRPCHQEMHREPGWQQHQPAWLRRTLRAGLAEFTGETREELTHALAFIESKETA